MMKDKTIDAKVTEIELLEAQIKSLKAMVDSLKSDLKNELDTRSVEVIDTGINKVWYNVYTKTSVNTDKLKDDGLYEKYSKESTVIMFKITKSK